MIIVDPATWHDEDPTKVKLMGVPSTIVASSFNPDQARVPKGNGRLSGRWIPMPGKIISDLFDQLGSSNAGLNEAKHYTDKIDDPFAIESVWNIRAAANVLAEDPDPRLKAAATQLNDFISVDWYSDPDNPPMSAVDVGADVDKAVALLTDGKPVKLDQPDEVATLIDDLNAAVKSGNTPVIDLCEVTVPGTNLFCADNEGIDRINMPQLAGDPVPGSKADSMPKMSDGEVDLTKQFRQALEAKGISVTDDVVPASQLRATQDQLVGAKVAGIAAAMDSAPPDSPLFEPIFVTKDNYIIDGHHRWAAEVARDTRDDKLGDITMRVEKIDMNIGEAIDFANQFGKDWGIAQAGTDPNKGNVIPTATPEVPVTSLAQQAIEGGFTFDTRTMTAPTTGFVVAHRGGSSISPAKNKTEAAKQIKEFLKNPNPPSPIFGGWFDKEHNEIVLDYVDILSDKDEAIQRGKDNNQQAIFDLSTGTEIDTGGTGDRPDG